ncbi:amine sulfotransferase-like [Spea bombifrons]|uniref:amine sulfotransferase-like n=1 Tax=Spea bombifrons TaxID=233779 RepID=UPI002349D040|nr:amine sulfotransferase-like [Spea bombifrons]
MDVVIPVEHDPNLYRYKGFCFLRINKKEYIDSLQEFKIRDDDVFLVTYPKSGTIWTKNILSLIYSEGHRTGTENIDTEDRVPSIEFNFTNLDFDSCPSPRLFSTHLSYSLVPQELRKKKGKVIYVMRNPKDVMTSLYHFQNIVIIMNKAPDFETLMQRFSDGDVFAGTWFDHVQGWYTHNEDFNILHIKYEDMIMDLRSVVKKMCTFLGKELDEDSLDIVVKNATFKEMKKDPRANKENLPEDVFEKNKGEFMRKGTIGDWKNHMTVAQRFDKLFHEKMKDLPITFTWDNPKKSDQIDEKSS